MHDTLDVVERNTEEFPPAVDLVDLLLLEGIVQCRLQSRCVLREDQRMDVEIERHGGIPQLLFHVLFEKSDVDLNGLTWFECKIRKPSNNFISALKIVIHHFLHFSTKEIPQLFSLRNKH